MTWTYLLVAGIFEIVWATGMKYSDSFRNLLPSIITISAMVFSFFFLSKALKTLPLGTGYAVWTGIGTIGTTIVGIILFGEPRDLSRIFCILLILFGIFGLKLVSTQ
jgi:quaternary ammonium compound-resistance protein SugE